MPNPRAALQHALAAAATWNASATTLADWLAGQAGSAPYKATRAGLDAIVGGYVDDLTRNFLDVLDGDLTVPAAVREHLRYLPDVAEAAYAQGMMDGGADPDDRDESDEAAINDWVSEQGGFVAGLWADVKQLRADKADLSKDEYAARQLTINDRLGQWGQALRDLAGQAKAAALKNMSVTWTIDPDKDHCDTCVGLDGKRHRLKWFTDRGFYPQEAGSDKLDCHGFHCGCTLVADNGDVILPA